MQRVVAEGDKIAKLSVRLGATTEALSQLQYVAERSGVEFATLTMGLQRMTRRIAEAARGTGEAKDALAELGLDARALAQLRPEDQFQAIARAMDGVTNSGDRVRLAMKLFDSEGVAIIQTMEAGAAGIEDLRREADALGLTLSQDAAQQMVVASDNMTRLNATTTALTRTLAVELVPAMNMVVEGMERIAGPIGRAVTARLTEWQRTAQWFAAMRQGDISFFEWAIGDDEAARRLEDAGMLTRMPGAGTGNMDDYRPPTVLPTVDVTAPMPGAAPARTGRAGDPFKAQREELRRLEADVRTLAPKIEAMGAKLIEMTGAGLNSGPAFESLSAQMQEAVVLEAEITAQIERIRAAIGEAAPGGLDTAGYDQAVTAAGDTLAQLAEARRIVDASLTPVQRYVDLFGELTRLRAQFPDVITADVANRYIAQLQDQLQAATETTRELSNGAQDLGWAFSSAFESAILAGEGLRGVLKGLLDDIARIILRQTVTAPIAAAISGAVAGMFPGFAAGGPVVGGRPIIVGEQGPELFVPRGNGTIVPNHAMGGGMAVTVNNHAAGYEARVSEGPGGITIDIVRAMLAGDLATGGQAWTRALDGRVSRGF